MSRYILDLIKEGEHLRQDFKFEITDSRKIARTLSAFSNTEGGKLLIGVKDNGHITGVSSDEEYHMIEAAAQLYCQPVVTFICKKWYIRGKYILEVDIPCSESKPVYARTHENQWLSYIRVHDQNILAPSVLLSVWKKQHRNKGIYFRYGPEKKILLNFLGQHRCISLSQYCRIGKLTRRKAVDILSDLVILKVISIEYTDNGSVYCSVDVSGES